MVSAQLPSSYPPMYTFSKSETFRVPEGIDSSTPIPPPCQHPFLKKIFFIHFYSLCLSFF
jgi:hypothetical protein